MPIRLRIEDDLLLIDFSGEVSTDDFRALAVEVRALERTLQRAPDRLADFTAATGMTVDYGDIDRLVLERLASPPANPIRSAVVGPQPVQFGNARIFQALNSSPHVTVAVFRDRASALAWLGRPSSPASA